MSTPRATIIIPTYNEAENIGPLLDRIVEVMEKEGIESFEVIVVDDDSPDGTCMVARRRSERDPRIRCILRKGEKGLSSAVVTGFMNARAPIAVVMDADFQHPPEVIPRLIRAVEEGADVAVATRYARGGGTEGWSPIRLLMSRAATLAVKVLVREARVTSDPLSGFFAVRLKSIRLDDLKPKGFKILLEILARNPCLKVKDVPYTFRERRHGESKLGFKVITDFLRQSWEISPMPRFLLVGASGVVVNLLVMWLTLRLTSYVDVASLAGIEASILSNYTLHETFTFRHFFRRDCKERGALRRLLYYHRASLASIITTYLSMRILVTITSINPLIAQFVGILLGFGVNYVLSVETVWECGRHGGCSGRVQEARRGD